MTPISELDKRVNTHDAAWVLYDAERMANERLQAENAALKQQVEQGKRDAVPVSIDSLLRTHPNLHQAVSILIQGANSKALYLWDQARQTETRAAAHKQEK